VTIAVNGAELLRLESDRVTAGARSLAQYVRYRCGLPAAVLANGHVAAQDLGVDRAIERHTVSFQLTGPEYAALNDQASLPNGPGLSIPQYVRTRCGLPVRYASMPHTEGRDREEDEAWEILDRLGLNADDYFKD